MFDALNTRAAMIAAAILALTLAGIAVYILLVWGWLVFVNAVAFSALGWCAIAVKIIRLHRSPVVVTDKKDRPVRWIDGTVLERDQYPAGLQHLSVVQHYDPRITTRNEVPALAAPADELRQLGTVHFRDVSARIPAGQMLVGVRPDTSLRLGTLQDFRSCLFLGKSGSGKTKTLAGKLTHAAKNGAQLIVIDPHGYKEEGLTPLIAPLQSSLWPGSLLAIEESDMRANLRLANAILESRISGSAFDCDLIVAIEEWNKLFDRDALQDDLLALTRNLAREGRGFRVFGFFGAQDMSGANFARYRKLCASVLLHRVEYGDAETLLHESRLSRQVMTLAPGATMFIDSYGDRELLQQPLISQRDVLEEVYGGYHPFTFAPQDRVCVQPETSKTPPTLHTHTLTHKAARVSPAQRQFILDETAAGKSPSAIAVLLWNDAHKNVVVRQVLQEEGNTDA